MRIRIDKIVFRDQSRMIVGKDDDQQKEKRVKRKSQERVLQERETELLRSTWKWGMTNLNQEKMKNIHRLVFYWKEGLFLLNFAMTEQPRYSDYLETLKS